MAHGTKAAKSKLITQADNASEVLDPAFRRLIHTGGLAPSAAGPHTLSHSFICALPENMQDRMYEFIGRPTLRPQDVREKELLGVPFAWPYTVSGTSMYEDFVQLAKIVMKSTGKSANQILIPSGCYDCSIMAWFTYPTKTFCGRTPNKPPPITKVDETGSVSLSLAGGLFGSFREILVCDLVPIRQTVTDVGTCATLTALTKGYTMEVQEALEAWYKKVWKMSKAKIVFIHGKANRTKYTATFVRDTNVITIELAKGTMYIELSEDDAQSIQRLVLYFPHPQNLQSAYSWMDEELHALAFLRDLGFAAVHRPIPRFGFLDLKQCQQEFSSFISFVKAKAATVPGMYWPDNQPTMQPTLPQSKLPSKFKKFSGSGTEKSDMLNRSATTLSTSRTTDSTAADPGRSEIHSLPAEDDTFSLVSSLSPFNDVIENATRHSLPIESNAFSLECPPSIIYETVENSTRSHSFFSTFDMTGCPDDTMNSEYSFSSPDDMILYPVDNRTPEFAFSSTDDMTPYEVDNMTPRYPTPLIHDTSPYPIGTSTARPDVPEAFMGSNGQPNNPVAPNPFVPARRRPGPKPKVSLDSNGQPVATVAPERRRSGPPPKAFLDSNGQPVVPVAPERRRSGPLPAALRSFEPQPLDEHLMNPAPLPTHGKSLAELTPEELEARADRLRGIKKMAQRRRTASYSEAEKAYVNLQKRQWKAIRQAKKKEEEQKKRKEEEEKRKTAVASWADTQ